MTGYQKIKQENENLKKKIKRLKYWNSIYGNTLVEIGNLKGPDVIKAPEMAWKAISEVLTDADKDND